MHTLALVLVLQACSEIVERARCCLYCLSGDGLGLESISAIVSSGFTLNTLSEFGYCLHRALAKEPTAASRTRFARTGCLMRSRCRWDAIVRHRVGVRSEVHGQSWSRATLPSTSASPQKYPIGIASARDLQIELLGEALANENRFTRSRFTREVVLADLGDPCGLLPSLLFGASVERFMLSILARFMHMVLHTAEHKLGI